MRRTKNLFTLLAACLALFGCTGAPGQADGDGRFTLDLADETWPAEGGLLSVPLRHDEPAGARIQIAFIRVFGEKRGAAPFFFLAGGPGKSGTMRLRGQGARLSALERLLLKYGDIFYIDQRGTGAAVPRLECEEHLKVPLVPALDQAFLLAEQSRTAEACAKLWRERGIDLQAFNTVESARDLEALRRELRLPRIRLLAASYGSHLAFAYLRRFGAAVELGVLGGIVGPHHLLNLPFQIDDLLAAIDAQQAPLADGRSLRRLASQARARLAAAPVRLRAGTDTLIEVGVHDFEGFLAAATSHYDVHRRLPPAIAKMAEGNFAELGRLRLLEAQKTNLRVNAMKYAMMCASGAPKARLQAIAEQAPRSIAGRMNSHPFPNVCKGWGVEPLPAAFHAPFVSEVPLLFFSGQFDARAPASEGREMLAWFPKGHQVIVSRLGHSWCLVKACLDVIEEFVAKGRLDRPRVIEISPSQAEIDRSLGLLNGTL